MSGYLDGNTNNYYFKRGFNYYFAEEANGDTVNDAIFELSSRIEENLNIEINHIHWDLSTVYAGEDVYDLALIHSSSDIGKYISDGIVLNWNDIPNTDMTKSYRNRSALTNTELVGKAVELPGYYNGQIVIPAFYNILLGQ